MVVETLIETVAQQIAQAASGPCRVILFGSHARGDAGPDSDLDLLVIAEEVEDRHAEMVRLARAVRELGIPVDVVVVSEAYADEWEQVPNTLVHTALCDGWEVAARPQDVAADIRQARDERTARIRRAVREAGAPSRRLRPGQARRPARADRDLGRDRLLLGGWLAASAEEEAHAMLQPCLWPAPRGRHRGGDLTDRADRPSACRPWRYAAP